jgi:hypothetical protein
MPLTECGKQQAASGSSSWALFGNLLGAGAALWCFCHASFHHAMLFSSYGSGSANVAGMIVEAEKRIPPVLREMSQILCGWFDRSGISHK